MLLAVTSCTAANTVEPSAVIDLEQETIASQAVMDVDVDIEETPPPFTLVEPLHYFQISDEVYLKSLSTNEKFYAKTFGIFSEEDITWPEGTKGVLFQMSPQLPDQCLVVSDELPTLVVYEAGLLTKQGDVPAGITGKVIRACGVPILVVNQIWFVFNQIMLDYEHATETSGITPGLYFHLEGRNGYFTTNSRNRLLDLQAMALGMEAWEEFTDPETGELVVFSDAAVQNPDGNPLASCSLVLTYWQYMGWSIEKIQPCLIYGGLFTVVK